MPIPPPRPRGTGSACQTCEAEYPLELTTSLPQAVQQCRGCLMRRLFFTTGSPFARAVRIVLVEKGLPFERDETYTTPSIEERLRITPTLQVPTLIDGDLKLWDSTVIIEYLMATYPNADPAPGHKPFAAEYVRPAHLW